MSKVISIESRGYIWHIPLEMIADNRAKYYAERDQDTTYQDEFDYVMEDAFEGLDWFRNNMDFADVAEKARLVERPAPLTEPDPQDYDADIVEVDGP